MGLPKTRKSLKAQPARLCVTVFGDTVKDERTPPATADISQPHDDAAPVAEQSLKRSGEFLTEEGAKKHCPQHEGVTQEKLEVVVEIAKGIAQHGPSFVALPREDQDWIK